MVNCIDFEKLFFWVKNINLVKFLKVIKGICINNFIFRENFEFVQNYWCGVDVVIWWFFVGFIFFIIISVCLYVCSFSSYGFCYGVFVEVCFFCC